MNVFSEPKINYSFITHPNVKIDSEKIPVEHVNPKTPFSYYEYSSLLRKRLERDLYSKSLKIIGDNELLIYDGPLIYVDSPDRNVVGIIKRHSAFYLENRSEIYNLNAAQRTRSFLLVRGENDVKINIASYYLRLFKKKNPYYGLIRVEIPYQLANTPKQFNEFAGFIYSERFPISFSLHQSDKKIYPISICEKYLSSKIPHVNLITAFLSDVLS